MKIAFFDVTNTGHHWFYNLNLILYTKEKYDVVYITKNITEDQLRILKENNIEIDLIKESNNYKFLPKLMKQLTTCKDYYFAKSVAKKKGVGIFVNLYFDQYILPYYFDFKKIKTINILHWYPHNKLKIKFLSLLKKDNKHHFLVHTNETKKNLELINKELNVTKLDYPIKEKISIKCNRNQMINALKLPIELVDARTLLYFGGTRHDKGVDILIESLKFVNSNISLLIVGKEETFTRNFIQSKISELKVDVKVYMVLKYIPEGDVLKYFYIADAIVLPYRKYFNGESGILTDAMQLGKPVVLPDIIHFPLIKEKYRNCEIFQAENPLKLAAAIDEVFLNLKEYSIKANKASITFRRERNPKSFAENFINVLK
ncbi:glycosyltransferase [Planococcus sp. YIM B11945]|uniref:glycosyltransferase n=1 Tax=Planococcus sp. YIM B11945 TaxID=3435410 RepID=UPI003D7DB4BB